MSNNKSKDRPTENPNDRAVGTLRKAIIVSSAWTQNLILTQAQLISFDCSPIFTPSLTRKTFNLLSTGAAVFLNLQSG